MRCPFCGTEDTQVKDSRPTDDSSAIRRRRQCPNCGARFTTSERVQLRELTVIKSNGQREPSLGDRRAIYDLSGGVDRLIDQSCECRVVLLVEAQATKPSQPKVGPCLSG